MIACEKRGILKHNNTNNMRKKTGSGYLIFIEIAGFREIGINKFNQYLFTMANSARQHV
jgi:hypothetical protein